MPARCVRCNFRLQNCDKVEKTFTTSTGWEDLQQKIFQPKSKNYSMKIHLNRRDRWLRFSRSRILRCSNIYMRIFNFNPSICPGCHICWHLNWENNDTHMQARWFRFWPLRLMTDGIILSREMNLGSFCPILRVGCRPSVEISLLQSRSTIFACRNSCLQWSEIPLDSRLLINYRLAPKSIVITLSQIFLSHLNRRYSRMEESVTRNDWLSTWTTARYTPAGQVKFSWLNIIWYGSSVLFTHQISRPVIFTCSHQSKKD
jgi:hypothetical protein